MKNLLMSIFYHFLICQDEPKFLSVEQLEKVIDIYKGFI